MFPFSFLGRCKLICVKTECHKCRILAEFNSLFLSLLFFAMVLNPIVLVLVTFYIFRILVYKFCLHLTPQEKHCLSIPSPASFVSMILLKWLFLCGFDHIYILIPQSLNDKKKFENQFKRCSYDNIV